MNPDLSQPGPTLPGPTLPGMTLVDAFDSIIEGLSQVMARACGENRFIAPICVLLSARLLRTVARFEVLFIRWRAGHLPAGRPPASHSRPRQTAAIEPALPRAFGWLLKLVPTADVFATMLHHLLTDPEMLAFLTEAPQAGRLLRPLCRTLGVKPIPQLLPPKNPQTAPAAPPPEIPPTAEPTTKKAPPKIAKNADAGASLSHADDPRWARPISLWCLPPRARD